MPRNKTKEKTPLLEENSVHHNGYGITQQEPSINGGASTSVQIDAETNNWIDSDSSTDSDYNSLLFNSWIQSVDKIKDSIKNKALEKLPKEKFERVSDIIDSIESIIEIQNREWEIDRVNRYGEKTQKRKDNNGNWEYKTTFLSGTIINEKYEIIDNKLYWMKEKIEENSKVTLELLSIINNKLVSNYKIFENNEEYMNFLPITLENMNNFQLKEKYLSFEYKFLEEVTIKTINNIDDFIKNTKLFNEKLILLKENSSSNLNVLLEFYKFLTIVQNFIDSSKPSIDTSTSAFFKRMWNTTSNLTIGLLQIYIGLTGKNLQRVVSNYPIDGKEHSLEEYFDAVFLNWQNYLMVFIDTALGTFLTSAMSTWSRDVIFNKENETNLFEIKQFNTDEFKKYKDMFEFFLYEENHQELMKYFSKITAVNDLMQKFNAIESSTTFQYHPNFEKEVETIQKLIIALENNNSSTDTDDIKKVISSANKMVKSIEKQPTKSLALANNWGRNFLVNFTLETLTWGISHVILTGSSENTSKESFNLQEWITKDIFTTGALIGNISRYFVMRPINNIFKAGLERLGIPTNLCPEKLSKWINKQSRSKKLMMAIPLFLAVTFTVNAVKTEAALTTENGIAKATELFYEKFFRLTTLGFGIGVTMIDMIAFAISDFYQDVFNQSINVKTLANILTKCCGFNKQETSLLEDNLTKLEKNGKLPTFDKEFEKANNESSSDYGIDDNITNSNDLQKMNLIINV